MNKFLIILICLISCNYISSQESAEWTKANFFGHDVDDKVSTQINNITITVDTLINATKRNDIVEKTKKYLSDNLNLINEDAFVDSLYIFFACNREGIEEAGKEEMSFLKGEKIGDLNDIAPTNMIGCIYAPQYDDIAEQLMKITLKLKWGASDSPNLKWISQGLGTLADPNISNCDDCTLEERYFHFLQNDKHIDLMQFPRQRETLNFEIANTQSAWIVTHLLEKYGVEKLKEVYQQDMANFEKIYGLSFNKIQNNLKTQLRKKYKKSDNLTCSEISTKDCLLSSIFASWHPTFQYLLLDLESEVVGNVKYSSMDRQLIERAMMEAPKLISENLQILNESEFNDSIHIVLVRDVYEMEKYIGPDRGGIAFLKDGPFSNENIVLSIYGTGTSPLKHELMHMVAILKWGSANGEPSWLNEGLAVYANPESIVCNGYTLEKTYVYRLQNDKLNYGAFEYSTSGYLVGRLIEKYGVEKFKTLWLGDFGDFKKIYGITPDEFISEINNHLNEKYPEPIDFDLETFSKNCME